MPDLPVRVVGAVRAHGQVIRQIALDESDPATTTVYALVFQP